MHSRLYFSVVFLLAPCVAGMAAAAPPPERLLPESARAGVVAPNGAGALRAWRNSQYRAFVTDPLLKPFLDDLARQVERGADLAGVVSACWEELAALASDGPAAVAMIPTGDRTALLGLLDVTGKSG